MTDLTLLSIADAAARLTRGEITSEALTDACLAQIAARDTDVNAFITVMADEARVAARAADRERAAGRTRSRLHGIPISIKDLVDLRGVRTTAGSLVRRDIVATADAPAMAALREAGVVFVGKTNLHEFAFGTTTEDSGFGPTKNPLDLSRSPGGSSGGSAASIVAGMALASIGTDTGGSIRIPSAACGLVGLKPTFGEVPTDGVVPLSHSMDHLGPLARTVGDAAMLYRAMRRVAVDDPWPAPMALPQVRIGIPRRYFFDLLDTDVRRAVDAAIGRLQGQGVTFTEVGIPHVKDVGPVYLHTVLAEAAAYHATALERQPQDYTAPVRIRLEMGRYVLAEDYVRAQRGRAVLRREIDAALAGVHGLLTPGMAVPATPLGANTVPVGDATEPVRNITLRLTQPFNLTGHPAIVLPCGTTAAGLPCSVQLIGAHGRTEALLQLASACEPYIPPGTSRG